jgi:hypothetical protein
MAIMTSGMTRSPVLILKKRCTMFSARYSTRSADAWNLFVRILLRYIKTSKTAS